METVGRDEGVWEVRYIMNLRKFKEIINSQGNDQENFRLFRVWANNCYDEYCKEMKLAYEDLERYYVLEDPFEISEECQEFDWEWTDIGYNILNDLYCFMGWNLDESIKKREPRLDMNADCLYYVATLGDVYSRLKALKNDVDYAYAIFFLIEHVRKESEVYRKFFKKVYRGIHENNLQDAYKLLVNNKKVFVAMWFNDTMKLAREKIEEAIVSCGYEPMLIDIKEHNNQIVPEIFKEIEDSEFVIADLTGHRGGVYYEAGYATAKGKQVILSCKEGEKTHFDVAQINTIYWRDEEDLYQRLVKRIKATIGENV